MAESHGGNAGKDRAAHAPATDLAAVDARLTDLRGRLDGIDVDLQRLLNERARVVLQVGEVKREQADASGGQPVFYRPEREAQILRSVAERNTGPYPTEAAVRLFKDIISTCLNLELDLSVGYLGPEGTFSQAAVLQHFGTHVRSVPLASIAEVFRQVENGALHYGVVPIENSSEGAVNHTLDCLLRSQVPMCGEVALRIHHHLLSGPATTNEITRIVSHQQSLAQCRAWLDLHWPHAERIAVASNGEAARMLSEGFAGAAIAGSLAAARYGLGVRAANIEDEANNTTRFVVIGRQEVAASGRDKTALLVATHNEAGALYRILEPLYRRSINLTRLEARPARTSNWTYVFFLDIEGHITEHAIAAAVDDIRALAMDVRVLGAFPKADT